MRIMVRILKLFLFIAVLGFFISPSYSTETEIYKQIVRNRPSFLHSNYAKRLASSIVESSRVHGIPDDVYAAILAVESSYVLAAYNPRTNDYGISQINEFNIITYKMDKFRLLNDLNYSVDRGAFILSYFYKRYSKREPKKWVCRYNMGTFRLWTRTRLARCRVYMNRIEERL